ncbi:MAG: hypothetical protein JWP66_1885 [Naasia sp.]|nr:hypothetical protein [Naasia sp.]
MGRTRSFGARSLALALSSVLLASGFTLVGAQAATADTAPAGGEPATVTSDFLPTAQVNGVVWAQEVVGNTVYVGGSFTQSQPAGALEGVGVVARSNLLAYNLTTGVLIDSFAPNVNGQVRGISASPDGSRIYVVGDFDNIDGQTRSRVAAFDTASGQLIAGFRPVANSVVYAVDATASTVYFGGTFTSVDGTARSRAAAVNASTGALTAWAPQAADYAVRAVVVSPDGGKVVLGGDFQSLNGQTKPGRGMGAVDANSGESLPWAVGSLIYNGGSKAAIWSLASDGTNVYGTGYVYGSAATDGNLEGAFSARWSDGGTTWVEDCHGDSYGVAPMGDVIYVVGHPHYCANIGGYPQTDPWTFQRAIAFTTQATQTITGNAIGGNYYNFAGTPAPSMLHWSPDFLTGTYTGQGQAAWTVTVSGKYVLIGGEFPGVNNKRQNGLVRFAMGDVAKNTDGPRVSGADFVPAAVSLTAGSVRLGWTANYDRDNENLTYEVLRDGMVVKTLQQSSAWWRRPAMSWTDTGLTQGAAYEYRLRVKDPAGNTATGDPVSVTVSGSGAASGYSNAVVADGATSFWRFGENAGSATVYDWAGASDLTAGPGVGFGATGAIAGDSNTAALFAGTSSGLAATHTRTSGPNTFSLEAWVTTTSRSGGKIVGFGNRNTGTSSSYDRHLYMDGSGRILFGVYPGAERTIQTATGFNDGGWHHVVGTLSSAGMQLFVDGKLIGTRTDTTSAQAYTGYWRVGGDSAWTGDTWFDGTIDEVAVYGAALSAAQVDNHYGLRLAAPNQDPSAEFTATPNGLDVSVDGSASTDTDGSLVSYAWNWGDGSAADSGAIATHSYAASGTYTVTLTVTDNKGATSTSSKQVSVLAANVAPTAAFTAAASNLTATFDATASSDPDGTLTGYAWNFGDGTTGSGATTSHAYGSAGTYTVQLTVTDDRGGTATTTQALTVSAVGGPFASDAFGRTTASGLGTADLGGAWTVTGSAANYSVASGTARFTTRAGATLNGYLPSVYSADTDVTATATLEQAATGSGIYVQLIGRKVGANEYRVRAIVGADGTVRVAVVNGGTVLAQVKPAGLVVNAGTPLKLRLQVVGTGTTSLKAKAWTGTEPAAWTVEATDTTAALQSAGSIGVSTYASGSSAASTGVLIDDLVARASTSAPQEPEEPEEPANAAPVASFTATPSHLTVVVDGSASTDSDGTIVGRTWDWGDATAEGSGVTASHTYATAGTYTVTMTVTDDDGATASATRTVTMTAPPAQGGGVLAEDSFTRTVPTGLGDAETGGAWTTTGSAANYSVSGGAARFATAPGMTLNGYLPAAASADTDLTVSATLQQAPTGGGIYLQAIGRKVGAAEYRIRAIVGSDGTVRVAIVNGGTVIAQVKPAGLVVNAGTALKLRLQVVGTGTTSLKAKAWTGSEPAAWTIEATDSTPALQSAGSIGLSAYASGSSSATTVLFDDLTVVPAAAGPQQPEEPQEPANAAPTASFTATPANLTVVVDGSASADADGTVVSRSWNWGDGTAAGSGTTASHTYAQAGTYTVGLTVTDDDGATATSSQQVTVTAPPAEQDGAILASDLFERAVSGGLGTSDTGGAWTLTGGAANFGVGGGSAVLTTAAGRTLTAYLPSVSSTGTVVRTTFVLPQAVTGGGVYLLATGRKVGNEEYTARVTVSSTGAVRIVLQRSGTALQTVAVPGLTYVPGQELKLAFEVTGTSPTTLRAKVWTGTEPAAWQASVTDSTAALQTAGGVGFSSYQSGSATATMPVQVREFAARIPE